MMPQLAIESKRKAPLGLPSTRVEGTESSPSAHRHGMLLVSGSTNNNCTDNQANGTRDLGLEMSEESGDPAVAVPAVPACELHDVGSEDLLVLSRQGFIPLSGPGLTERSAGSTLRDTDDHSDMLCALATTGRAQKFPSAASLRIWFPASGHQQLSSDVCSPTRAA